MANESIRIFHCSKMGSLPNLSVIKGPTREFQECYVDQLFESVANGAAADNIAVIFEGKHFLEIKRIG